MKLPSTDVWCHFGLARKRRQLRALVWRCANSSSHQHFPTPSKQATMLSILRKARLKDKEMRILML